MNSLTRILISLVLVFLPSAVIGDDIAQSRCEAFYTGSTPGTVRISTNPIGGHFDLLPQSQKYTVSNKNQKYYLVYNHRGVEGDEPSYLATFEVAYLNHNDEVAMGLFLSRNKNWKRRDQVYKSVAGFRNRLAQKFSEAFEPERCVLLLDAYRRRENYAGIDSVLETSGGVAMFDGEPFLTDSSTLSTARALSSVVLKELNRCNELGETCTCQFSYTRFVPLSGGNCSSRPVVWESSSNARRSVFFLFSPFTPNMTGRVDVQFVEPTAR